MLKEIEIVCPHCRHTTIIAVASPEADSANRKGSTTSCRRCRARILTVTDPDGTVYVARFDAEGNLSLEDIEERVDTAFGLSEIVKMPFGLWQPGPEEIGQFEHRPEWAKALAEALRVAQARPRPLSVPRRIFLSYRWSTAESDQWVARLQDELEARGNIVVFDRDAQDEAEPPSVPDLVARIAGCHIFLAVIDPGYVERLASRDTSDRVEGWVTDEFHTALAFANRGVVTMLGMLREGDHLPRAFRPFRNREAGNTFDVRSDDGLQSVLDRFFVQRGTAPKGDDAARAAAALHDSQRALIAGDYHNALVKADDACALVPDIADAYAQRARVTYRVGQPARAFRDAMQVLQIDPMMEEMLIYGAAAANDLAEWRDGARMARMALERNPAQANAHYLLGKALNELNQVYPAIAHFEIARRSGLELQAFFNDAAWAHRRAGDPQKALDWYAKGLDREPAHEGFLVNSAAAAMEAGQPSHALSFLERLVEHHPESQHAPALAQTLSTWLQNDLPAPVLSPQVDRGPAVVTAVCDDCRARIPMCEGERLLCAGCGSALPKSLEPCGYCAADGKVVVDLPGSHARCPYCNHGRITKEFEPPVPRS